MQAFFIMGSKSEGSWTQMPIGHLCPACPASSPSLTCQHKIFLHLPFLKPLSHSLIVLIVFIISPTHIWLFSLSGWSTCGLEEGFSICTHHMRWFLWRAVVSRARKWRGKGGDLPFKLMDSTSLSMAHFILFYGHISKISFDEVVLLFRNMTNSVGVTSK